MTKNRIHIPYCRYKYLQSRCVEDFYNCKLRIREILQYSVKQFRPKVRKRGTDIARPAAPDTMIGPGYVELLGCQFGPTVPDQELIEF